MSGIPDPTDVVKEIERLHKDVQFAQHDVVGVPQGESAISEIRAFHRALNALRDIALRLAADNLKIREPFIVLEQENARLKAEVERLNKLYGGALGFRAGKP